jgi:hypothetical protein
MATLTARVIATGMIVARVAAHASGQELEPRVYLATPVGSNLIVGAMTRAVGDVVFDPTIPIENADARVTGITAGYYRSFGLFGRSANLGALVSFAGGTVSGLVAGTSGRAEPRGLADLPIRLTVNLRGSPAMDTPTFVKRGLHPELGLSIAASLPVGGYDPTKVVNVGMNRWAIKPELGFTVPVGPRWRFDVYGGVWLFAANPNYLGRRREQNPLVTTQFHVSYNLTRRAWAAFNSTFYAGGKVTTDGSPQIERQNNTRLGATLSLPIAGRQAIRVSASSGAWVRVGRDFTTIGVVWSYGWGRGF